MSFFAQLFGGCCGRQRKRSNTVSTAHSDANETSSLLSPPPQNRPGSIISGDEPAFNQGYGTQPGLSQEERNRLENIGRNVGGRMLAINSFQPLAASSPSPTAAERTAPEEAPASPTRKAADVEDDEADGVRTVSLGLRGMFAAPASGPARGGGRGRGRGRGRGGKRGV